MLAEAFALGVLATLSPCALPLYPGFLAYLAAGAGAKRSSGWLGLAVLAGVLTTMLAMGALIAALAGLLFDLRIVLTPLADLAVIGLGIALLLGRNPFARLPMFGSRGDGAGSFRAAYGYGLLYGPIAFPCSGGLVVSVFALAFSLDAFAQRVLFFLAFGLGLGVPLLVLSLLARATQDALLGAFVRHYALIARLAGAILVVVGVADLANNLPIVLLTLGL